MERNLDDLITSLVEFLSKINGNICTFYWNVVIITNNVANL